MKTLVVENSPCVPATVTVWAVVTGVVGVVVALGVVDVAGLMEIDTLFTDVVGCFVTGIGFFVTVAFVDVFGGFCVVGAAVGFFVVDVGAGFCVEVSSVVETSLVVGEVAGLETIVPKSVSSSGE